MQINNPGILDGAVTTAKLADDAVTAAKIAAGAVGASEIADGSVGNAELANDAVTGAKISNVWEFESADTAITVSTAHTFAHGLGATPKQWGVWLACVTAEIGYAVGDEILIADTDSRPGVEHNSYANATNVVFVLDAGLPVITNPSTFANTTITAANWRLRVRART